MSPPFDFATQIEHLHVISQEMLKYALCGEWEIVQESEVRRRTVIEQLFQEAPPAEWIAQLQDAVQATLAIDARVQELACRERDRVGEHLRMLAQGRRALGAYDDT